LSNFVSYNGVQMGFVRTKALAQEPVQLGPDYASQRFTATWEVTLSRTTLGQPGPPDANGVPGVAPTNVSGLRAFTQLHDRLLEYRKALRVNVAGVDVVNVPANGDVQLGPKPLSLTVVGVNGHGSLTAEYTVQYVLPNPCNNRNGVMAILGHVWKAEDDVDKHFFMTRTYTGILNLDPRVVGALSGVNGIHPDTIRALYLPPRTPGLHREACQVKTLEDGYTLAYRIVDRQPTAFVNSKDVVRMEADHKVVHGVPGKAAIGRNEIDKWRLWSEFAAQLTPGTRDQRNARGTSQRVWDWGMWALDWVTQGIQKSSIRDIASGVFALTAIPTVTHTITATAFGHPASPYSSLASAGRVVTLFRLMNAGVLMPFVADFDGMFSQHDRSDPKAVTTTIEVTSRPRNMTTAPKANETAPERGLLDAVLDAQLQMFPAQAPAVGQPQQAGPTVWDRGDHAMPRLQGNTLVPREIVTPAGLSIPPGIRQLVYGGSIFSVLDGREFWGWLASTFAPDLMSPTDGTSAGPQAAQWTRVDAVATRGVNARTQVPDRVTPLQATLLAAIQDPCGYKATARFASTTNRGSLP
jgi:hypothetical protein